MPYAVAAIVMIAWGRRSDAKMERRFHTAAPIVLASFGLVAAALLTDPAPRMIAFSCAAVGCWAAMSPFWSLCFSHLPTRTAAGSIAAINAIANLGGFTGPSIMGFFRDRTGDFTAGLLALAAITIVAVIIVLMINHCGSDRASRLDPKSVTN
ncbi:putative tartrate transporter [compost metagenome]